MFFPRLLTCLLWFGWLVCFAVLFFLGCFTKLCFLGLLYSLCYTTVYDAYLVRLCLTRIGLVWLGRLTSWHALYFLTKKTPEIYRKGHLPPQVLKLIFIFKNTHIYCDYEIYLSTLQLHQIFKSIRLLT